MTSQFNRDVPLFLLTFMAISIELPAVTRDMECEMGDYAGLLNKFHFNELPKWKLMRILGIVKGPSTHNENIRQEL